MIDEKLVDEIYAILVERFGIGELFLPKYGNRKTNISWKMFIRASIDLETAQDLYTFCGYKSKDNFSMGVKKVHKGIVEQKNRRSWNNFLLGLISYKKCPTCSAVKQLSEFSLGTTRADGVHGNCKGCDSTYHHKNKEKIKFRRIEYYNNNKHIFYANNARRRGDKLRATPNWADQVAIKEIYQTCPEGYHVDHIIPLQNDIVCGLHCEFNLQHLTAAENLAKSNKFEVC